MVPLLPSLLTLQGLACKAANPNEARLEDLGVEDLQQAQARGAAGFRQLPEQLLAHVRRGALLRQPHRVHAHLRRVGAVVVHLTACRLRSQDTQSLQPVTSSVAGPSYGSRTVCTRTSGVLAPWQGAWLHAPRTKDIWVRNSYQEALPM